MIILLVAPAALMLGAATETSILDQAFGNTVVETYPDGSTAELWLARSGDYTALGRTGHPSSGHWRLSGGKVCLSQTHPWLPIGWCTPVPAATSWSAKAPSGQLVRVRLVMGVSTNPGPG
ncbi:MAG TPA: hypothetical protein VGH15_11205 [Caulobacteraceae bacterium]